MKSFSKTIGNLRASGNHYIDAYGNEDYIAKICLVDERCAVILAQWKLEGMWILRFLPHQILREGVNWTDFMELARYGQEQLDQH